MTACSVIEHNVSVCCDELSNNLGRNNNIVEQTINNEQQYQNAMNEISNIPKEIEHNVNGSINDVRSNINSEVNKTSDNANQKIDEISNKADDTLDEYKEVGKKLNTASILLIVALCVAVVGIVVAIAISIAKFNERKNIKEKKLQIQEEQNNLLKKISENLDNKKNDVPDINKTTADEKDNSMLK